MILENDSSYDEKGDGVSGLGHQNKASCFLFF